MGTDTEQLYDRAEIYRELKRLARLGVLDYVLPTEPLSDEWVLGIGGTIAKLTTKGEMIAFFAGVRAVTDVWAKTRGVTGYLGDDIDQAREGW